MLFRPYSHETFRRTILRYKDIFIFKILQLHFKIISNKQKKIVTIHKVKKNIG
jgi:hypothetical protein